MQLKLELLAPAKNYDIGIAAIDCGADAVYIAGPSFGAREAAGNPVSEIKRLADYAHLFSVNVYATVNTILFDNELEDAFRLMEELRLAGVDAFIIQDLGIFKSKDIDKYRIFASTQTNIRTPEQACFLEALGCERLILERQLSLSQIAAIRKAVNCDLEFFVHGALCTSYSGQCYLSRKLSGRSANRGECIQACRSKYNLTDCDGVILRSNESILSLKDLCLDKYVPQLIEAGISSFKIEGRLKNISYVKNVVRHYRNVIDAYIKEHPQYCKSSFGEICGGFTPNVNCTFNRGYTSAFIEGTKGKWNSREAAKSLGEYLGEVTSISGNNVTIETQKSLSNGDGLAFTSPKGEIIGMRADVCNGNRVKIKDASQLIIGGKVFRNLNIRFEKELEKNSPKRLLKVEVKYVSKDGVTTFTAKCENGATVYHSFDDTFEQALNPQSAIDNLQRQFAKRNEPFVFALCNIESDIVRSYPISALNSIRRSLAEALATAPHNSFECHKLDKVAGSPYHIKNLSYLANVANAKAEEVYRIYGVQTISPAYEITAPVEAELMRTKYCIKYELGLCPKQKGAKQTSLKEPLYLTNVNYKLKLRFDCEKCEMVVIL